MQQQFLAAYDAHADAIFRHCYFRVGSRDLAKDLTQQVFLNAWEYLQKGSRVDALRPFLYRVAHNLIVDWYRRHKTESLDSLMEEGFNVVDTHARVEEQIEWRSVLHNLKKLDVDDRNLITWRYVEDLSPAEIAEMLGVRENAA